MAPAQQQVAPRQTPQMMSQPMGMHQPMMGGMAPPMMGGMPMGAHHTSSTSTTTTTSVQGGGGMMMQPG